jgi:hypothetical protein
MTVGDGQTAIFWEDRWIHGRSISEIAPELYSRIPKRRRKHRTVADGLQANNWAHDIQGVIGVHEIWQYLRIWRLIEHTVLTTEPDRLVWTWNSSGEYTANSAYLATFQGSIQCKAWRMIWKAWAPP